MNVNSNQNTNINLNINDDIKNENNNTNNTNNNINDKLNNQIKKKILFFEELVQKTMVHNNQTKLLDLITDNEYNTCTTMLIDLNTKILNINMNSEITLLEQLQNINNDFSSLIKKFGTQNLYDLLLICIGNNIETNFTNTDLSKFELLKKYFHPLSYKLFDPTLANKYLNTDPIVSTPLGSPSDSHPQSPSQSPSLSQLSTPYTNSTMKFNFDKCDIDKYNNNNNDDNKIKYYDNIINNKKLYLKINGLNIEIKKNDKSILIINGYLDESIIMFIYNDYINNEKDLLHKLHNSNNLQKNEITNNNVIHAFDIFCQSLTLKDYLISDHNEMYNKYLTYINNIKFLKEKSTEKIIKDFDLSDIYNKRILLIQLLIDINCQESELILYLLYDLLSSNINNLNEQKILFNSFPITLKKYFKNTIEKNIDYIKKISDISNISYEHQICLMKTDNSVKEKAMQKLKEFKQKNDDSGSKAKTYLLGLLKIPFNIYKKEPILYLMDECKKKIKVIIDNTPYLYEKKENYTNVDIVNILNKIKNKNYDYKKILSTFSKKVLINILVNITNSINSLKQTNFIKINTNKNKIDLENDILHFISFNNNENINNNNINNNNIKDIIINYSKYSLLNKDKDINYIERNLLEIHNYIPNIRSTLDKSIHGHNKAKRQIEKIICQWINGKQDGYCFGFEGPPGVGKTSLAKYGISNCLKDENGEGRPFAMIQIGGDTNGSSLHGHNYTYHGASWGSIVQILMDKKCMNPIIFIDEIDKISKTENGKEIIGILTHLLDSTQNNCFQDKYFSGIDIDLSKALFILSFNDVNLIDKVLLDRIHLIKFNHLSLEEKLVISNKYILPEIYEKMGLQNIIKISDEVLIYIIESYTIESGVRKLKEILFDIIGEINIEFLKYQAMIHDPMDQYFIDIPFELTKQKLEKYVNDKYKIKHLVIHKENKVGLINGLWANTLGQGGILPIEAKFYPDSTFLNLKLTGMLGDVIKESMNVALTMAWNLTDSHIQKEIIQKYGIGPNNNGIHIHCPDGSTNKDGPSAGITITTLIYSLLNNKKIKNDVGLTGEITLSGDILNIGSLEIKILGGIKAGIKQFIYPEGNNIEFAQFMDKYKNKDIINNIQFHPVKNIQQIFDIIFE
jgi:hypothetical protein